MNPGLTFLVLIVVFVAAVTWWLLRALKKDRQRASANVRTTNVEALRIERSELDRDRKLGLLTDQAHTEAVAELEVRVLREAELDRATPVVNPVKRSLWASGSFAVLLPLTAIGMYFVLGAPQAVIPEVVRPDTAKQESQMDELFRVAEERLKAEPNDAKGWYLLARAKASIGRFDDAMKDYEKLVALTPNDADAWADYADAAAGAAEGKMEGKPIELIAKALAIDPKQPKALLLKGTHEIQRNDLSAAEKTFTLAKSVSEPSTAFAQIAENALKDIAARRAGVGSSATAAASASSDATAAASASAALAAVTVTLSDEAKRAATSAPNAALFIIVRAPDRDTGPPLAAKKIAASAIGSTPITLSAGDAMIGGSGLAVGTDVVLEARLSLGGQPQAQPGDFRSAKQRIKLGDSVKLTLAVAEKV